MGVLVVVWYAHKTLGSSSGQMPFVPSSRVLMILIPNSKQKSLNALLSNYFPLSETSTLGIPYLQIMFLQTKLRMFFSVIVAKASASTHFVKYLMPVELQLFDCCREGAYYI